MKFPTLKHRTLCMLVMLLPLSLLFFGGFVLPIILGYLSVLNSKVAVIIILIGGIGTVFYALRILPLMTLTELTTYRIAALSRRRAWYSTEKCGKTRAEAERVLLDRTEKLGEVCFPTAPEMRPLILRLIHRKRSDCVIQVYSTDRLGKNAFEAIAKTAKKNAESLCEEGEKKQESALARLMKKGADEEHTREKMFITVILTDAADPDVPELARKKRGDTAADAILLCVGDMGAGRFYFDDFAEPSLFSVTSAHNRAMKILAGLIFDGKIPYRDNPNTLPPEPDDISGDMPLFEYLRKTASENRKSEQEDKDIFQNLPDGGALLRDVSLYCKLGDKGVIYYCEPAEEDPELLEIYPDGMWNYPKFTDMKPQEEAKVREAIEAYLTATGQRFRFISE